MLYNTFENYYAKTDTIIKNHGNIFPNFGFFASKTSAMKLNTEETLQASLPVKCERYRQIIRNLLVPLININLLSTRSV